MSVDEMSVEPDRALSAIGADGAEISTQISALAGIWTSNLSIYSPAC